MKLRELLYNIIDVTFDIEIKGVTCNPKRVKEGYLFVCISKEHEKCISDIKTSAIIANFMVHDSRIYILHPNPQEIYSKIVSRFYQFKQPKYAAAVTGTNGKTSVIEFCCQIWQNAGYNAASIGTLGMYTNNERKANHNSLTTPDADDFYATLCDINSKGIEYLALEASSHGIDQYRIHGLELTAAAFTNLSQDHLDYHQNISKYFKAKKRLFHEVLSKEKTVILNANTDKYYALLKIAKKRGNKVITYGEKSSNITLIKQVPALNGQYLTIRISNEVYNVFFPVFGQFQACNLMCAIGIAISSGLDYKKMCIDKLISPPGRMEKVKPFVFVDYAHTPSALKQAILSLKWHFNKKIVLVFGCGGNRDQAKRAEMGKIAQMYAEKVIITNDNPRDENPTEIRRDILLHCPDAVEVEDRKEAIEKGIDISYNKGMILLIAGKGHERFQIINGQALEFSDVEVVRNYAS
ncbi:UDP-N-acetylmuramyl tripeptide synthase [Wolbachia endosymbiont of Onchocerca ochengi]|uniref:Mur ligase family protein n=1 Tax=Wolbachia endosymbiont of Onchocerca ochengi TaxID=100901 RepID=UPI00026DA7AD|nr:UDP-N-acetylmuramoyl-L-alanyl-D-glutamate--2,6-diaminopimelate ligase [Wolbachia endosymbiont of Onchocerca ochengi]CCF78412.1 UDP-N-acetylmuramyl tripeptide synthase [Wolbachia endosymbiont of Onchocerca ochengi]